MKKTWCLKAVHTDCLTFYTYWCSLDLHIRPNIEILWQNGKMYPHRDSGK